MIDPKTKIVATLGPASSSREVLREMMLSGMDVCRLNFSHGNYAFYIELIRTIREVSAELGQHTAILADLQGPKMRVGEMQDGPIDLVDGSELVMRETANGWSVIVRQRAISAASASGVGCVSAVSTPRPPAFETAAASSARPTHCMPPWMIG